MSDQQQRPQPAQRNEIIQVANSLARLDEIRQMSITSPTIQAEAKGLLEFVSAFFLEHGHELLGCWFAVRDEYEPLVNIVARMSGRVRGIFAQAAAAQVAENQSNIIRP